MHVPSNRRDRLRQRSRRPWVAVSMLALAIAGSAQAAAFDEKTRAPMMTTASGLRAQAEPFAARYRALRDAEPERLVRDPAIARQQFDLKWQLLRAVERRAPLDDVSPLGLIAQGDGSYQIDLAAFPEWDDLHETIAGMLSRANLDATGPALVARGFRADDLDILKDYVAAHDSAAMANAELVPLTLEFGRLVRKYDKVKRPVPDTLVESFYYQRARILSESKRRWVEGLLQALDAQRGRILMSTFLETKPTAVWAPSDLAAASAELLAEIRKPDFEARVKAEAKGVAP